MHTDIGGKLTWMWIDHTGGFQLVGLSFLAGVVLTNSTLILINLLDLEREMTIFIL